VDPRVPQLATGFGACVAQHCHQRSEPLLVNTRNNQLNLHIQAVAPMVRVCIVQRTRLPMASWAESWPMNVSNLLHSSLSRDGSM
jgi:hypothetical protein